MHYGNLKNQRSKNVEISIMFQYTKITQKLFYILCFVVVHFPQNVPFSQNVASFNESMYLIYPYPKEMQMKYNDKKYNQIVWLIWSKKPADVVICPLACLKFYCLKYSAASRKWWRRGSTSCIWCPRPCTAPSECKVPSYQRTKDQRKNK